MAKLLIISGLSRSGKSTIINRISSEYKYRPYWNDTIPKIPHYIKNKADYFQGMFIMSLSMFSLMPDQKFILDRCFLDELVYSKCLNRETYMNIDLALQFLDDNDFQLILLDNEFDYYIKNSPKEIYTKEQFEQQRKEFEKNFNVLKHYRSNPEWQNRFIKIDSSENNIEKKYKTIKSKINE